MSQDETITVTTAALKAYEQAAIARAHRAHRLVDKLRASDALDAAKVTYDRAVIDHSDAIDAEIAAAKALHGGKP